MRYLKPHFYDQFTCTAGDCPDTCCAGWQIVIDEDSLERYGKEQGEFGKRLRNSIDWEEECFYQKNRRCAFLNDENLCDLYKALGPDALCDTCRLYPRHTEEYEGLRELSLSLSCPEAARIILSYIPKRRSASLNATVFKTSAGAASWLPVARVSNLAATIDMLKENGVKSVHAQ